MYRPLFIAILVLLAVSLVSPEVWAKKNRPATTTAATQASAKNDKDEDAETHKSRAKEMAGKDLDKEKTKAKVDKLNGQVNDLEGKLRDQKQLPPEADAPKRHRPSTQPATKPAAPEESRKARLAREARERAAREAKAE